MRLVATEPGTWTWQSGSIPADPGLAGKNGSFTAAAWTEPEKQQNTLRRGFLRPTANQHGSTGGRHAFLRPRGHLVGHRQQPLQLVRRQPARPMRTHGRIQGLRPLPQGARLQLVNMIAAFPNWMTDGQPSHVVMNDAERTTVRSAWLEFGRTAPRIWTTKAGALLFPGKVPGYENMFPDVDRVNPEYFHYLDRKIDYLNDQGFVPFIEVSRRDASPAGRNITGGRIPTRASSSTSSRATRRTTRC